MEVDGLRDPHQRQGYALWSVPLGAGAVAARLTERGARGDDARATTLRETASSFGGLPGPVRAVLLAEARSPVLDGTIA